MKCEYIDLYQIHWPTRDCPLMSTPTFAPGDKNRFMPSFDKGTQEDFDRTVKSIMELFDAKLIKHWQVTGSISPRTSRLFHFAAAAAAAAFFTRRLLRRRLSPLLADFFMNPTVVYL